MNFGSIKNDNASADVPHFELDKGNDILKDARSRHNYEVYQSQYKKVCGVMPELDKIHNPVCAVINDNVFMAEDLQKNKDKNMGSTIWNVVKGGAATGAEIATGHIGGALVAMGETFVAGISGSHGTEHYHEFKKAFTEGIEKYKYAYSLMCSYDLGFIKQLPVGEFFPMDNLGYKKTEDGAYYEGTWQDDELLYGLMCASDGSFVFIGTFDDEQNPDEGIMFDGSYKMGLFKNYELNCLHGVEITTNVSHENMSFTYFIEVGGFEDGHENGEVIRYMQETSGNIMIFKDKFDYGDIVKPGLLESLGQKTKSGAKKAGRMYLRMIEIICYISGGLGLLIGLFAEPAMLAQGIITLAIAILCTFIRKRK